MNNETLNAIKECRAKVLSLQKQENDLFESLVKELNLKDDDYLFDAIFNSESEEYFQKMIERLDAAYWVKL